MGWGFFLGWGGVLPYLVCVFMNYYSINVLLVAKFAIDQVTSTFSLLIE